MKARAWGRLVVFLISTAQVTLSFAEPVVAVENARIDLTQGNTRVILNPGEATSSSAQLKNIRLGRHEDYTRFVFDLTSQPAFIVEASADQRQLVLQIDDITVDPTLLELSLLGTPVTSLKLEGETRLVFVFVEAVDHRAFILPSGGNQFDRLVLDLYSKQDAPQLRVPPSTELASSQLEGGAARRQERTRAQRKVERGKRVPRAGSSSSIAFSGTWQQEWAVADHGGSQKFEAIVEPRLDMELKDGIGLTAIGRLRLDTVGDLGPRVYRPYNYSSVNGPWYNDKNASIDLRELYVDWKLGRSFLRLGKQQVVWGESDGIKVLDVVNPQSFREFILDDFDDSRIPLWMVNAELPLGDDGSLQLLWIPDTTYHELAEVGTPYELTSPLLVPQKPASIDYIALEPDKPDDPIADSDVGARYRMFVAGWDLSLNYLYSYADFPVPFQGLQDDAGGLLGVLDPEYKRNHLLGGTASTAFGDFSLRTELAWNSDRWFTSSDLAGGGVEKSEDFASVLGLDWQRSSSSFVSAQWFYSRLMDYRSAIVRDRTEQMVSLLLQQSFVNDTWEIRGLALHSLDYNDSLYQLKLKYWYASEMELYLGTDIFDGKSTGVFGQFDNVDRVLVGFQYGF